MKIEIDPDIPIIELVKFMLKHGQRAVAVNGNIVFKKEAQTCPHISPTPKR